MEGPSTGRIYCYMNRFVDEFPECNAENDSLKQKLTLNILSNLKVNIIHVNMVNGKR